MPHDEHGNAVHDEAFLKRAAEIQGWLMQPYRDPANTPPDPDDQLRQQFWELVVKWEEISTALTTRFKTTLEDGADWQEFEADIAMNAARFWWIWGN